MATHEAVALRDDVKDAGAVVVAGTLRLALEDLVDEVVLAILGLRVELEFAADLLELGDAHLAEVRDIEVVALARGLELLGLFVFAYRSSAAASHGGATTGTAIAHGALIWTGHLDRGHL